MDSPEQVADAWEEALNSDRPVVYEAITDPEIPPHIRFGQATSIAKALAKGEPNGVRIMMNAFKGKLREATRS